MNLFGAVEKLINEHGSASILKERIKLIEDRYKQLEEELSNQTKRAEEAEAKCTMLEIELQSLDVSDSHEFKSSSMTPDELAVLELLGDRFEWSQGELLQQLSMKTQRVQYVLEELINRNFVESEQGFYESNRTWRLKQDGRRFLLAIGKLE